ncbi:hypothetical protein [Mesorhizobium sp. WSM2239]|uniref:Tat pathway signal sequence domain protein n=2 Tax=unclassified Mesorhizobium TaxID=325217 RepID=A0AAU8DGZ6_9HYPH
MAFRNLLCGMMAASSLCTTPASAVAQEKALSIELNEAVDLKGGCRLSFVALNVTGVLLDKASFDVFTFDGQGKVAEALVFEFGRLPAGKTKVVQFDLADQACNAISRLLINDVTECVADGKNATICIDALKTTTRTSINFGL